ncbi:fumarylacetoacetate hydrolase family protein [Saccharopolyspora phatthalungensis]|uniref:Acylpyruvate hydrolase n=1 Tax=Saccharopolyspora phatthalungensis TaxID=664693 RepID=A0A840QKU4_9PSEU|nr:fumarylacetoacetate hydrolase family protein [Saccharopolyspora phatthalungensis]MBB5159453.1 acylpyruvate hydrolase [Saccharopolyspora phatthalungensis]
MRLTTLRTPNGTRAARIDGDTAIEIDSSDVGALLSDPAWRDRGAAADGPAHHLASADLAPVVPRPGKIFCVGLNYRGHILEMGRDLPENPTLFAKFADALIGPSDPIALDPASAAVDWEAELAVVVGTPVRRASEAEAAAAIAGFAVLNDVTMRDWQYRTLQWLQGKTFEATTPFGPYLVTPDELPGGTRPTLDLRCAVDGETVQAANTSDLVFDPVALIAYISRIVTLNPGDVIATGTPGGVGHARDPKRYLTDGATLTTEIQGLGAQQNTVRATAGVPA